MKTKENLKQNKAITLVALVITIIILLILATVTIVELKNTNLFSKTIEAKNKYKQAAEEENNTLDDYANKINEIAGGTSKNNEPKKTIEVSGNKVTVTENGTTYTATVDTNKDPSSTEKDSSGNWKNDYDENTKDVLSKVYGTAVEYKSDSDSNKDIDSKTWRIFYIDFANKYGDGEGTIYLKADFNKNDTRLNAQSSYTPSNADKITIQNMNQKWWAQRGKTTWNENENFSSWLCSPTQWKKYKNNSANYAIGGPSTEIYCDSYNSVNHSIGNNKLTCQYQTNAAPGYGYLVDGKTQNSGFALFGSTSDYEDYNSMYCGVNKALDYNYSWFLASPSAKSLTSVSIVDSGYARLNYAEPGDCKACPFVSLPSSSKLNIK